MTDGFLTPLQPPEPKTMLGGGVLLVDDDQPNLDVLRAFLEGDATILEATSGDKALALLDRPEIDVIVTDQRMPGLSGVDLLRIARERRPDVVGIVLTAFSDTPVLISAINDAGAFRFLRKPWRPEDVLGAVEAARSHVAQQRTIAKLMSLLQERNQDLSNALSELQAAQAQLLDLERLATTGRMAAGIAHDLRNAMNGLVMIEHEARHRQVDADLLEVVDLGLAGVRDLLASLETLGTFARQKRLSMAIERLDLSRVMRDAVGFMKLDIGFRRRVVTTEIPESMPLAVGDRQKLVQCIINLIRNAVQATKDGQGIKLVARMADDGYAELIVQDEGIGLSDEVRETLFQAFVSTKGEGGLGLGLYMASLIVAHHSGTLRADSVPTGGTMFTIRLPTTALAVRTA